MDINHKNMLIKMHEKSFSEMYVVNTIISMIKQSCTERENNSQYYGLTEKRICTKISDERNDYINMLTLLSDKISSLMALYVSMEKEISLYKDANNCSR